MTHTEREYVVSLHEGMDYDQFWQDMEQVCNHVPSVPVRPVDIVNERPGSLRSCHYALTDQEAEQLRQDPRVICVELTLKDQPHIKLAPHAIQYADFTKTSGQSGSYINWGLRRCVNQTNPYGTGTSVLGEYPYTLDGTGVDIVITDSGIQPDHPEFTDTHGVSRVQLIDWYLATGLPGSQSINFYRDYDGHGTHVAGICAGKTYGWAKNARIYSMKLAGLEGVGDSGTGIDILAALDIIKVWHQQKSVDPTTGYPRPTVVNMSWGFPLTFTNITGGSYRGTPWSGTTKRTDLGMVGNSSGSFGYRYTPTDVDVSEMLAAGIIVCVSAGNYYQKADVVGGDDYNNYFTSSAYGALYYHRGSSPHATGVIRVGSTDVQVRDATTEYKSVFSDCGPLVDIWAPGSAIQSACSTTNRFDASTYYANNQYRQTNLSGTSMSSPQVAGVCALYLQLNPWATPSQIKAWLLSQAQSVIYDTGLNTDYTNNRSIQGSANTFLFNQFNSPQPLTTTGSLGFTALQL